ncbi:S66 peptidase family protein [Sphingomonas sp.]|uniref:S66 peptidase family protein n=1 Tax=Sphingomonas sp. TaxID=28214 RepID=UPI002FC9CC81
MLGLGALAAALALPAAAAPAAPGAVAKPPRLRQGDVVGLIAPAGFSDDLEELEQIKSNIAGMGLVPKVGAHVLTRYGYLAGSDHQRAADLNAMYADKDVCAVFAVHGGWGSARMLPHLDWKTIRANPKLLVGFSDITALHLAFAAQAGFPTVHAPNAANGWLEQTWNSFWTLAFQGDTPTLLNPDPGPDPGPDPLLQQRWRTATIRVGKASGRLLGGNLSVLAALVGTPYLPDFSGAILFLEDTGEAEYRIDRMLTQLGQAGILRRVAGVVFGQCTGCQIDVTGYSGFSLPQVLAQHLVPLGVPAFSGALIGHVANQFAIPVGVRAEIDAAVGSISILEPAVAI